MYVRNRNSVPKASKKRERSIPKFIKDDVRETSVCAIHFKQKPRFGSPKRRVWVSGIYLETGNKLENKIQLEIS